ncbi:MAG TPA: hypothetical protein PKX15_05080, partial [Bacteroidales bacterium]|nr:hypothetical protein [Bacteroidales bacterium]
MMLKYLLEKEFKQFLRNRFLPKFAIIFPFAILSIFPLVTNTEIKNIRLCVVDNDKSGYAYRLTEKIKSKINSYIDHELNSKDEYRVKQILQTNEEAAKFYHQMSKVKHVLNF